jgi:glutamate synthase (NADPH/NADH) large chain
MDGVASHWLVRTAIGSLACLTHRGAVAADGKTGDGCGLLLNKPDEFLRAVAAQEGFVLNPLYAVGMVFLNQDQKLAGEAKQQLELELATQGLSVAGWRTVPINPDACGDEALESLPVIEQVFINAPQAMAEDAFERHLYISRRRCEKGIDRKDTTFYVPSLSARVISYKGLIMPANLPVFYHDLNDERMASSLCVFHQRFSTNTWPEWRLAQPFRYLAHNGEINTIQGNRNWAVARGHKFETPLIPDMIPVVWITCSRPCWQAVWTSSARCAC